VTKEEERTERRDTQKPQRKETRGTQASSDERKPELMTKGKGKKRHPKTTCPKRKKEERFHMTK
jgi:hypothetical protein